jgi:hypothetical protein
LARLTAAPGTTTVASRSHWLRLVNGEISSPEFVPVELGNRAPCAVSVVHLDKRESSRLACGAITHDADSGDRSSTLEERLKIGLRGLVWQVADVQFGTHELLLHLEDAIGLMAGSSGMLDDDTQERRETRIYARGRNAQQSESALSVTRWCIAICRASQNEGGSELNAVGGAGVDWRGHV